MIERRVHPQDPRAVQVALTRHGITIVDQAIAKVRALQEELTAPLGGTQSPRSRELVASRACDSETRRKNDE